MMLYQKIPVSILKVMVVLAVVVLSLGTLAPEARAIGPMSDGIEILSFDDDQATLPMMPDGQSVVIEDCPDRPAEVYLYPGETLYILIARSVIGAPCNLTLTNSNSVSLRYREEGATVWLDFEPDSSATFQLSEDALSIEVAAQQTSMELEELTFVVEYVERVMQ